MGCDVRCVTLLFNGHFCQWFIFKTTDLWKHLKKNNSYYRGSYLIRLWMHLTERKKWLWTWNQNHICFLNGLISHFYDVVPYCLTSVKSVHEAYHSLHLHCFLLIFQSGYSYNLNSESLGGWFHIFVMLIVLYKCHILKEPIVAFGYLLIFQNGIFEAKYLNGKLWWPYEVCFC